MRYLSTHLEDSDWSLVCLFFFFFFQRNKGAWENRLYRVVIGYALIKYPPEADVSFFVTFQRLLSKLIDGERQSEGSVYFKSSNST